MKKTRNSTTLCKALCTKNGSNVLSQIDLWMNVILLQMWLYLEQNICTHGHAMCYNGLLFLFRSIPNIQLYTSATNFILSIKSSSKSSTIKSFFLSKISTAEFKSQRCLNLTFVIFWKLREKQRLIVLVIGLQCLKFDHLALLIYLH